MKKIIAILLTALMLVSLVAVSSSAEDYTVDTQGKTDVLEGIAGILLSNECNYKVSTLLTDGIFAKSPGGKAYLNEKACAKNAQADLEANEGPWTVPLTSGIDKPYYYTIEFCDVNADIDSFSMWFNNENTYSSGIYAHWHIDSAFDILASTDGGETYFVIWESVRMKLNDEKTEVLEEAGYTIEEGGNAIHLEEYDTQGNYLYSGRKIEGKFDQTIKGVTNIMYGCVSLRREGGLDRPKNAAPFYYVSRITEFDVYGTPCEITEAETTEEEKPAETTAENITTAAETAAQTTPETAATPIETTAENKQPEVTTAPAAQKSGCGSSVACGVVALVAVLGAALLRKKEN